MIGNGQRGAVRHGLPRLNGARLGFLGFLGFLGCMMLGPDYAHVYRWSLLSLLSFTVFIPVRTEKKLRYPIRPARMQYLNFLGWLSFLGFMAVNSIWLTSFAAFAFVSLAAVDRRTASEKYADGEEEMR